MVLLLTASVVVLVIVSLTILLMSALTVSVARSLVLLTMLLQLLSEMEACRSKSLDHAQEMIAASFGRPLPKPGMVCHIRSLVSANVGLNSIEWDC